MSRIAGTFPLIPGPNTIHDPMIVTPTAPGNAIGANKTIQRHRISYAQESATSAADEARVLHVVRGVTGTVLAFDVGCVVANIGVAIVEVDLLLNGVTMLSAVVEINVGHAAYEIVGGTLASTALVVDDVLEVSIDGTAGAGTLGKGVFAIVTLDETPA